MIRRQSFFLQNAELKHNRVETCSLAPLIPINHLWPPAHVSLWELGLSWMNTAKPLPEYSITRNAGAGGGSGVRNMVDLMSHIYIIESNNQHNFWKHLK